MSYQPDFFDPRTKGLRAGCVERLVAIRPHVNGDVLDVGCSEGFFSFGVFDLAKSVLGVDPRRDLIDICRASKQIPNVDFRCTALAELLRDDNSSWDTVLYLSVHHHLIKQCGMAEADRQLCVLLSRARCTLFDMGQKNEKGCRRYGWWSCLPAVPNPDEWIRNKLRSLSGRRVKKIGSSPIHGVKRGLWKIA